MRILVTGAAGFIGFHTIKALIDRGDDVYGLDNINDYYDRNIKFGRLRETGITQESIYENKTTNSTYYINYRFFKMDICDKSAVISLFKEHKFDKVCHLAAQAGVRYSLTNPDAYIRSNIEGFLNILESCRNNNIEHLVYASSSSVYGLNETMPFSVCDNVDHPVSLYAASKKSNELMAHAYSYLYNIPTTGLRFFTVYGPWGRPDMALFLFTKAILEGRPIDVYNNGDMQRDFTYVDDVVKGILLVIDKPPGPHKEWSGRKPDPSASTAPYRIYNIGNNAPVKLLDFISVIEKVLGKKAKKNFLPIQKGDVPATWADCMELQTNFGYKPETKIQSGIEQFIRWYRDFYGEE